MGDTDWRDWREILSYSQKDLKQADKDKLCESLSWMEADDIELNFTDLKTLFRLAQDILKYKSEQVNNLLGRIETSQKKKSKSKGQIVDSPNRSVDNAIETITHQEEVIKANKDILEQLYADIAELEGRKKKIEVEINNIDIDSESSRDALSEINAMAQLETEITMKNKHIRKLLGDVKVLDEENSKLKIKVSVLKDKLTEATKLIENFTEQLLTLNNENSKLKEILGKSEEAKANLSSEIETMKKKINDRDNDKDNVYGEIKSKAQHWRNIARSKKAEIEALSNENMKLKGLIIQVAQPASSPPESSKDKNLKDQKIKELQEKLSEASNKITESANVIDLLKAENRQLKSTMEEVPDSLSESKNESDDGKERAMINKLKKKIKVLTVSLREAEEMLGVREKELTEIASQLQILQSDDSIGALLQGIKNKKHQLRVKDEGIKSLVQEINNVNELVDNLQLENEVLREKLNIPRDEKIPLKGTLEKYYSIENNFKELDKEYKCIENKLVSIEMENRNLNSKINKLIKILHDLGYNDDKINLICESSDSESISDKTVKEMPPIKDYDNDTISINRIQDEEMQAILEENEGLRKGLQDILNFLKDNSTTTSGILSLECPSLETLLRNMEARHTAGWFAPHMSTVIELRAALGGKDALLTALHEARKETFDVMSLLQKETQKAIKLEQKLHEIESLKESQDNIVVDKSIDVHEFGSWISEKELVNIDIYEKSEIHNILKQGNSIYENQLKNGLIYFHIKFKKVFDKLNSIAIQTSDDINKWAIQEEKYKTEIENLKAQLSQLDEEDISDVSPGLIESPNISYLQRKCNYLEESYKHIRTLNENMKNEILENKKEMMIMTSDYESQIQCLILSTNSLIDRLRSSIPVDLFWKQNFTLNEITIKYRKVIENNMRKTDEMENLLKRLENVRNEIIHTFQNGLSLVNNEQNKDQVFLSNIEQSVFQKQIQELCNELQKKDVTIEQLEKQNEQLQDTQAKLVYEDIASMSKIEIDVMKNQLQKISEDNILLKQQYQNVKSQLDIVLLELQETQQSYMANDMEINMLKHQILDLQSSGDNKAILARLGGEVLVAHLQALESNKKIERLSAALNKEKQSKIEAEEMLKSRQYIFEIYSSKFESKLRYMCEIMQILRQQYQGCVPLTSIENYLNNIVDLSHKTYAVNEKLSEIEGLQSNLIDKHTIFDQILDVSKNKCLELEDSCPHNLKLIMLEHTKTREIEHLIKKNSILEESRETLVKRCNELEKTLVLLNQGFGKSYLNESVLKRKSNENSNTYPLEVEDIHSDDETNTRKSQTITLPDPRILLPVKSNNLHIITNKPKGDESEICQENNNIKNKYANKPDIVNVSVQTIFTEIEKNNRLIQTDDDTILTKLNCQVNDLVKDNAKKNNELTQAMSLVHQRSEEILKINNEKLNLASRIEALKESNLQKEQLNQKLHATVEDLKKQLDNCKYNNLAEINKIRDTAREDNKSILTTLKKLENERNNLDEEYKELLKNEREEYSKSMKNMNIKIMELQTQLDRKASDTNASNTEALKDVVTKYTSKINDLEDKCFQLQSELDGSKSELVTYHSELDRWKQLASERLVKMEQLNSQLERRHCHEVESYKAENQHWLTQLNETQKEHMELRTRLTEQKAQHVKQLAEKDSQIEQLRTVVHNLKAQIMNMQTMISVNDPSFDLSAIVEVEESSDILSQQGSDRLELKFDSSGDLHELQDDIVKMPATSTAIWQEPLIDRLRREKQFASKQNVILRRQIKALAAREKRSRLDAQNLKSQIMRLSASGGKTLSVETAALHNKISALQSQLTNARRDTHSSIALWDKWKRAQQAADRWQSRYEEKFQEAKKLESNLNLAKSTVNRLEKEKRVLLTRLSEVKNESILAIEKQDSELLEKSLRSSHECRCTTDRSAEGATGVDCSTPSTNSLMARIEAQQRRIVALESAEKGNEFLVAEYEKALAEITSLKGQVLKLESALLESQIQTPMKSPKDSQPELDYWKSYCEMLKEENVQLTLRANAVESVPSTGHHRVNDLERTVLTLRGLVSKLQAEQKSSTVSKRVESRPSSASVRSTSDKLHGRSQLESHRIEIANLKRSIMDKDLLLEKSKEMLKIAAEREDDLLRENAYLRRQIAELTRPKGGFLSA